MALQGMLFTNGNAPLNKSMFKTLEYALSLSFDWGICPLKFA